MRTIKFRGKDINTGEWLHGDLVHSADGMRCAVLVSDRNSYDECEVDPSTVGQFTGMLDQNGREIYEGDIVRYYDDIEDELVCGHVIYHKESCSFCIAPTELCGDYVGVSAYWQFEVIGNIFDNPELLSNKQ